MTAQLPMPIRPGQSFVQAVQANFDHLMGELHNIAESLNDLVTDQNLIKDLLGGTIDSSEELAGEYHDTIADATIEVIESDHVGAADPHPAYETSAEAQAKVDVHTGDTVDAHDASAVSFAPAGTVAATDVQAAIEEVATEAGSGGGDDTYSFFLGG